VTVIIGHPTGNPNFHNAALSYFEAGHLEALCTPWMPSPRTVNAIKKIPVVSRFSARLSRRSFAPLKSAPAVQDRARAIFSLLERAIVTGGEVDATKKGNEWLMKTLSHELGRSAVTAVHSFEDCSLAAFRQAKRRGKACIYDMPIGYFEEWRLIKGKLTEEYEEWVPRGGRQDPIFASDEQKTEEMALADLVLVPSAFVEATVRRYNSHKAIARAAYGVDTEFWTPGQNPRNHSRLRFIFAGRACLRKGTPLLIEAWTKAALPDAELHLIGGWGLNDQKRQLPEGVTWHPPCSSVELRQSYQSADVMVFPTNYEGFPLVILEAMACGLPVIATSVAVGSDLLNDKCGIIMEPNNLELLVDALRSISTNRGSLGSLGRESRKIAERCSWGTYRNALKAATAPYI
jgi:glycosyltransferase involved in cell wall biosynthesis